MPINIVNQYSNSGTKYPQQIPVLASSGLIFAGSVADGVNTPFLMGANPSSGSFTFNSVPGGDPTQSVGFNSIIAVGDTVWADYGGNNGVGNIVIFDNLGNYITTLSISISSPILSMVFDGTYVWCFCAVGTPTGGGSSTVFKIDPTSYAINQQVALTNQFLAAHSNSFIESTNTLIFTTSWNSTSAAYQVCSLNTSTQAITYYSAIPCGAENIYFAPYESAGAIWVFDLSSNTATNFNAATGSIISSVVFTTSYSLDSFLFDNSTSQFFFSSSQGSGQYIYITAFDSSGNFVASLQLAFMFENFVPILYGTDVAAVTGNPNYTPETLLTLFTTSAAPPGPTPYVPGPIIAAQNLPFAALPFKFKRTRIIS